MIAIDLLNCMLLIHFHRVAFKIDGKPWLDVAKHDFRDAISEFKDTLGAIGKEQGWTLADLKARFSNDLFDKLIFDEAKGANGSS